MGRVTAIVVAAGRGVRAGGGVPKQYRRIGGVPVLRLTLERFCGHGAITDVVTVIHPDDQALYEAATAGLTLLAPVAGGATRQASVRAGLSALAADGAAAPEVVLVHDAARPFVSAPLIDAAIAAARAGGAAVPGLAVTDTLKRVEAGMIGATVARDALVAVQTPQGFRFSLLADAHRAAAGRDDLTDDAAVVEAAGGRVAVFPGEAGNVKLTTEADFAAAEARALLALADVRVGTGFDVHAFVAGDHVTLGGVRIPHDAALSGHSDADVVLHAATDALLGALGEGDIGVHFPPSDMRWKGASSDRFLAFALERLRARGGVLAHLHISLMAEAPKVGPHREAMRASIARICGVAVERIGITATTMEKLGFVGRREGLAATATATIRLPLAGDTGATP
jgi:2-C-methyl-D-erythritol 4-phosphate cytidylyltransferase/2-C-methyl-D-erythritol 2,4-cyclodiphosphate synthase